MSYDLYCYRARSGVPNSAEAQAVVEAIDSAEEAGEPSATSDSAKQRITAALIALNPRLKPFKFDFAKISELDGISEKDARLRYQHVELNPPDGDLVIQLTVYDDQVSDPEQTELRDHKRYDEVVKKLPRIAGEASRSNKPWWKFW